MLNSLIKWHAAARRLTGTLMDGRRGGEGGGGTTRADESEQLNFNEDL